MFQEHKRQHPKLNKFLADFTVGGLAAFLAKAIGAPIERARLTIAEKPVKTFNNCGSPFQMIQMNSLFKDLRRYVYPQAMNFALFEQFRSLLVPKPDDEARLNPKNHVLRTSLAGGLAGFTSLVLAYPVNLVQLQLQRAKTTQLRGRQVVRYLIQRYGMGGLYLGIGFSLPIVSTYRAIYFGGYFSAKDLLSPERTEHRDVVRRFMIAQGFATLASTIVYPMQIIRSDMIHKYKMLETRGLKTWFSCARAIWRTSGTRGLYQGFSASLWTSIASAFTLVFFDELQSHLSGEKRIYGNSNHNNQNNQKMLSIY